MCRQGKSREWLAYQRSSFEVIEFWPKEGFLSMKLEGPLLPEWNWCANPQDDGPFFPFPATLGLSLPL